MTLTSRRALVAFLLCVAGSVRASWADPISARTAVLPITSGRLDFDHASDDPSARGQLAGNGFAVDLPFVAGTAPTAGGGDARRWNASFSTPGIAFGTLQFGDTVFELMEAPLFLNISASTVRTPTDIDPNFFSVQYPFRLTGRIFGRTAVGDPFLFQLTGQGIGGSTYVDGLSARAIAIGTELTFRPPSATPEPAGILLVATAGGWIFRFARRRRRG